MCKRQIHRIASLTSLHFFITATDFDQWVTEVPLYMYMYINNVLSSTYTHVHVVHVHMYQYIIYNVDVAVQLYLSEVEEAWLVSVVGFETVL